LSKCQNAEGVIHDLISVPKEYLRYEEYVRLSAYRNLAACPNCRTPYFYSSLPSNLQNEFNKKRKSEECFIATAAMDSHLHPYVQSLRNFRDNILLQSRHKTSFENLLSMYYRLSPTLARSMNRYLILKIFLRYALVYPIVFGIKGILPVLDVVLRITNEVNHMNRS
jgi:hypothetical protein